VTLRRADALWLLGEVRRAVREEVGAILRGHTNPPPLEPGP
jgi:hypothetical protein